MRFSVLFLMVFLPSFLFAQTTYRSPVDFPVGLSATFGEPRTNHYHSGIDIRTQQVVGKNIYAIADGYVSRILVSPSGYGKALYIAHPDGKTSVYGHLLRFNEKITKYVTEKQYKDETFAINLTLESSEIPVKKGDIVALSGNSGSSGGPHLHFEIRDTETEEPLNPQTYGFKVEDKIPPTLKELRIIPKTPETTIKGSYEALNITLTGSNGKYKISGRDTIRISGAVSFGINAVDQSTGSTARNGVYSIKLLIDGKPVFSQKMDSFNFNDSRCVNCAIDYSEFITTKKRFQTTEIQPGNTTQIYEVNESNGIYSFDDKKIYTVKYEIGDIAGNIASFSFHVEGDKMSENKKEINGYAISWNERFDYVGEGVRFSGDSGTFFDNFLFKHSIEKQRPNFALSSLHIVGNPAIPMKISATLAIKLDAETLKKYDSTKLLIVFVDNKGNFSAQESHFNGGYVIAQIREMGRFAITADVLPPNITPVNISERKKITTQKSIQVKISDNLSGINTYVGKLNDKWILMDYDRKNRLLEYTFDDRLQQGENVFTLEVTDYAGNSNSMKMNLIY